MHDVIIIGGGPTGSHVAYKLAMAGYDVVVLEQKHKLGEPVCCTGIISQECVNSFGISDSTILRREKSARLFSPSGKLIRLQRERIQFYIVDRALFDTFMAGKAQHQGAEYLLNSRARDIKIGDDEVSIEADCPSGRLTFKAKAAVIANGFNSKLTRESGLGKAGDFVMGAQARVETSGVDEIEVYFRQEISPGFYGWLVPISPNQALAGLLSRHHSALYMKRFISFLSAQGKIISEKVKPSYRGIPLKVLPRTYSERLIIVGDAAGQVKPTNGGGIFYGLLCADVAAKTLHSALERDDLSAKSLAQYQRWWKKKLQRELTIEYWARKFYERLSDRQIDKAFDVIKSNNIDEELLKSEDLSVDWYGKLILRTLRYKAVSKALGIIRAPFQFSSRN